MPTLVQKTLGSGKDFTTFTALRDYINGTDLTALDQTIEILVTGTVAVPSFITLAPINPTNVNRVKFRPDVGQDVNVLNKTIFDKGDSGAALTFGRNNGDALTIRPGIDFDSMRLLASGGSGSTSPIIFCTTTNGNNTYDNNFTKNRIYDTSLGGGRILESGNNSNKVGFFDNLVVMAGSADKFVIFETGLIVIDRCTFVSIGSAIGGSMLQGGPASTINNSVFIGFGQPANSGTGGSTNFTNTTPAGKTTGITVVTGANALVENDSTDYRPKIGGALIGAASATANNTTDIVGGNRAEDPDVGAWQRTPFAPTPTGRITNISINAGTVTISGTTTNTPTSGTASLDPTNRPNNGAVAKSPIAITLGTGTFTVSFPSTLAGEYTPTVTLVNAGGSQAAGNDAGLVVINGPVGTLVSQTITGQSLTITGTVTGAPDTGSITVPVDPASTIGGTQAGPSPVTITGSNFSVTVTLMPGQYLAPVVRFTSSAGTGFPVNGTSGVAVLGFDGNPEAPEPSEPPVITSVTVSPATATGSTTFTAVVAGPDSPPQTVNWTTTAGSITSSGVFTAPAATSSVQNITVTATSAVDATKSGTATVTIAASAVSTVTGVSVSPGTATGSTTFSATVNGTNGPSQAVTWTASAGAISSSGAFTAPAAISSVQNITITARSVQDSTKTGTATVTIAATSTPPDSTSPPTFVRSASRTIIVGEVPGSFDQDGRFWSLTNPKKPTGSIDPNSTIDITFDWTKVLADIDAGIANIQFDILGLTTNGAYGEGAFATIFVSNATGAASITCRITTDSVPPRIEDRTVFLTVEQH